MSEQTQSESSASAELGVMCVPVGFGLGRLRSTEIEGSAVEDEYAVRSRDDFVWLNKDDYDLWWTSRRHIAAGSLLDLARKSKTERPATRIEGLLRRGLLALLEPDAGPTAEFATRLRMVPTGVGGGLRGNAYWLLSGTGEQVQAVDYLVYMAWSACDGQASLAQVAQGLAALAGTNVEAAYRFILVALPALLEAGTIYIDQIWTTP
jgi:hypothetical protein